MPFNYNASKTEPEREKPAKPSHEKSFQISAPIYSFDDLILPANTMEELKTVVAAQQYRNTVFIKWNLRSVLKDKTSLLVNLYGEPGTGKTMAAHAIVHDLGREMICVNYAEIESKYVGETSKNLMALFRFAESKNAVLFFDEADALLSKRVTNMSNATDVSVNQTRSVLLTLLNDYKGMVIFASNFISNYDPAFMRRIQYHICFALPNEELRKLLWRKYIPREMPAEIDFADIAKKYSGISGSDISNAVLKAALLAARRNMHNIPQNFFEEAVENIIGSKEANSGYTIVTRPVSEEYALEQIQKNGGKK